MGLLCTFELSWKCVASSSCSCLQQRRLWFRLHHTLNVSSIVQSPIFDACSWLLCHSYSLSLRTSISRRSAKRSDSGTEVAIKKIKHMCESISDAKHTVREIRLMRYLGRHENIISLKDLVVRDRYVSHAAKQPLPRVPSTAARPLAHCRSGCALYLSASIICTNCFSPVRFAGTTSCT